MTLTGNEIPEEVDFPIVPMKGDPEPDPEPDPDPKPDPEPAPDPEPEPIKDPEPDPEPDPDPEPIEESDEFTEEEWKALSDEERETQQKAWDNHQAAQGFDEDAVKANLKELEGKMQKAITDAEERKADFDVKIKESDKFLTQKSQQISEAAKGHPEVSGKLDFLKELTKQNREDENRQALNFKPAIYFDQSNTPRNKGEAPAQYTARLEAGNKQANAMKNRNMLEFQDMFSDIITPIMPEIEQMRAKGKLTENHKAWGDTGVALHEELGLPKNQETVMMFFNTIGGMEKELMDQGTSLSPDARTSILRSKILLAQSGFKPGGAAIQFNGKAPPGKLRGRKPPRRPPDTIAGRGTGTPSKKGRGLKTRTKVGDVKITNEYLTAGGRDPDDDE